MGGMMEFEGPGMMMLGPEMERLREQMPRIREQIEPLLRERLNDLPERIQLRSLPRVRTISPVRVRSPRLYRVDRGGEGWTAAELSGRAGDDGGELDAFLDDMSDIDAPFILDFNQPFEFENEIEPVSPAAIRELVVITVRDARVALEQLAADRIA